MTRGCLSRLGAVLSGALVALPGIAIAPSLASATDEVEPQLINGATLTPAQQKQLGLVTINFTGGVCSGTLLNRFWVLTADHCVTTNGAIGGPADALTNITISATWSTRTAQPTKRTRYWAAFGRDVALLFLGAGDLSTLPQQPLAVPQAAAGDQFISYGRGINAYAFIDAGGVARPTVSDGRYRFGQFAAGTASNVSYLYTPAAGAPVNAGGDSGGASHLLAADGVTSLGIAGVTSSCNVDRLPGMPATPPWTWVSNVRNCTHSALFDIRADIEATIREGIVPCKAKSKGCAVAETTSLTLMLH